MNDATESRPGQGVSTSEPKPAPAHKVPSPFVPPYRPSWFDRFTDWVDRLPVPQWMTYALIALAGVALVVGLRLLKAVEPGGDYTDLVTVIQPWFAFGAMHYLDRMAGAALDATRGLLRARPRNRPLCAIV